VTLYEEILYEVDDPVATITLNRPEVLNAWTDRMGLEVRHAVAAAQDDPRVIGIVITGAGRGFCAGADMSRLSALSSGTYEVETLADELAASPGDPSSGDDLYLGTHTYLLSVPSPSSPRSTARWRGWPCRSRWPVICGSWPRTRCSSPRSPSAA